MRRDYTQEDIESVFRFLQASGLGKEELFELMNDWTPWVSDKDLEKMWRERPRKVVLQ
jgi:hypothetical protein